MACVSDDESNVVGCREGDSLGYVCPFRHVDRIVYIITQSARTRFGRVRITALVSVEWCHDGRRRHVTAAFSASSPDFRLFCYYLTDCS